MPKFCAQEGDLKASLIYKSQQLRPVLVVGIHSSVGGCYKYLKFQLLTTKIARKHSNTPATLYLRIPFVLEVFADKLAR